MTGFEQFRLVVAREVRESFRRTSVRLVIAVLFVVAVVGVTLPDLLSSDDRPSFEVIVEPGVAGSIRDSLSDLAIDAEADLEIVDLDTLDPIPDSAREAVEEGQADAALLDGSPLRAVTGDDPSDTLVSVLLQAASGPGLIDRLVEAGVSVDDAAELAATPPLVFESVDADEDDEQRGVAFGASIVLYMSLLTVTIQVANGTAIEKASRISEVLLAVVRPGTLLFGKVVGVGLVSLTGVVALIIPVVGKAAVGGSLPPAALPAIGVSLLWFVLGLAFWAPVSGMAGSLVERQEEVGTAVQPITLVMIASFFAATSAADTVVGAVLAQIPLTSPIVEPTRIVMGESSAIEAASSLTILLVAAAAAIRFGGVVYRRAIVRTGRRLKVRDLL